MSKREQADRAPEGPERQSPPTSDRIEDMERRNALAQAKEDARWLVISTREHDTNATVLTNVRKTLRMILDNAGQPTVNSSDLCASSKAQLESCIDAINVRIITSRKLTKGEMP